MYCRSPLRFRYAFRVKQVRRWFCVLLLLSISYGAAQTACDPVAPNAITSVIPNLGTAYFNDFSTTLQDGEAELSGGVCVAGAAGWALRTEVLRVADLETTPTLEADDVTLELTGWTLRASSLRADTETVRLTDVTFRSGDVTGEAQESVYDLDGAVELTRVSAQGKGFRVQGARARLQGDNLLFEDALATTCVCEDGALYVIRAPSASYDLSQEAISVREGRLEIGGIDIALDDVTLSPERLADLTFPVVVEYVDNSEDADRQGTGLGIRVPSLPAGEGARLEFGVVGLDSKFPLNGILLLHYADDKVDFDVGKAARGVQADVSVSEGLLPGLDATFAIRNRHWDDADFLHEGLLALDAEKTFSLSGSRLSLGTGVFGAVSSQTFASDFRATDPTTGVRLGSYGVATARSPVTPAGRFSVAMRAEVTRYPPNNATQYGLFFRPAWSATFGPARLSAAWDLVRTNGASPFSTSLDRLESKSLLSASAVIAGEVAPDLKGSFSVRTRYDLLDSVGGGGLGERFDLLTVDGSLTWLFAELEVTPFARAELAPLLNTDLQTERESFVEGGFDVEAPNWQVGASVRLDPEVGDLSKLETRASLPVQVSTVTLQPYLALDFLPTLNAAEFPRVSGHGLEVTWRSCCGTFVAAYRNVENAFSTSFAVRFGE